MLYLGGIFRTMEFRDKTIWIFWSSFEGPEARFPRAPRSGAWLKSLDLSFLMLSLSAGRSAERADLKMGQMNPGTKIGPFKTPENPTEAMI